MIFLKVCPIYSEDKLELIICDDKKMNTCTTLICIKNMNLSENGKRELSINIQDGVNLILHLIQDPPPELIPLEINSFPTNPFHRVLMETIKLIKENK